VLAWLKIVPVVREFLLLLAAGVVLAAALSRYFVYTRAMEPPELSGTLAGRGDEPLKAVYMLR